MFDKGIRKLAFSVIMCCLMLALAIPAVADELVNCEPDDVDTSEATGGGGPKVYYIYVPDGVLTLMVDLQVSPDSPAMSLGVNFDSSADPTDPGSWECSQTGVGSLTCQVDSPLTGNYYILASSLEPASGTLTATYIPADQPDNNAWQKANLTAGQTKNFTVTLPEGTNQFKANLHTSFGSAVLFTKAGSPPAETDYDCTAFSQHGNAQCIHHRPVSGAWYVTVLALEDSLVSVQTHYTENQKEEGDQDQDQDQDRDQDRDQTHKPDKEKKDKTNNGNGKSKNK